MELSPHISIITINYNDKIGLERTIESIVNQSSKEFEYIVIDGDSSDGSKEVIETYKDKIDVWISEPDKGIYNAMNKGIRKSKGEYLLFINSGDELHSLNSIKDNIEKINSYDLIYFNINVVDKDDSFIKKYPNSISFSYLFKDTLPHPATFIKKSLFDKVGLYDEKLKIVSDWKFFILALSKHNATYKYYDTVFSDFYFDGISSKPENIGKVEKEKSHVLNTEFNIIQKDIIELYKIRNIINTLKENRRIRWLTKLNILNKF